MSEKGNTKLSSTVVNRVLESILAGKFGQFELV